MFDRLANNLGALGFLIEDRGPIPRVFLQRDPALERKRLAKCRSLVGRAGEARGQSIELQGLANHAIRLSGKSHDRIVNPGRRFRHHLDIRVIAEELVK